MTKTEVHRIYDLDGNQIAKFDSRRPDSYKIAVLGIKKAADEKRITRNRAIIEYLKLNRLAKRGPTITDYFGKGNLDGLLIDTLADNPHVRARIARDINAKGEPTQSDYDCLELSLVERSLESLESQRQVMLTTQDYLAQMRNAA